MNRRLACTLLGSLLLMFSSALLGQTYTISTFAGGGPPDNVPGTSMGLSLAGGVGMAADAAGNVFFATGNAVFRLDHATGTVKRVAGIGSSGFSGDNGPAISARLSYPTGFAVDPSGNNLYFSDSGNNRIRKVSNGMITTVAGNGFFGGSGDNGPATSASLEDPAGLAVDSAGDLYIADTGNNRVREVSNGVITTVAGSGIAGSTGDGGPAGTARLARPVAVSLDSAGNLYIADQGNQRIREVSNGVITSVAGNGVLPLDVCPASNFRGYVPSSVAVDAAGNLYVANVDNHCITKVSNGVMTTVAGTGAGGFGGDNGPATSALLDNPGAIAVDAAGNLYFDDESNLRIRMVSNGVISTIAGNGRSGSGDNGPATSAQVPGPAGVAVDSTGALYIVDIIENSVRKVANGVITTISTGPPSPTGPTAPFAAAVDSTGNLYIADVNRILMVSNGVITTVAGNGTFGSGGDNGPATSAQLSNPAGIAVDAGSTIYIADLNNNRIRKVSNGVITTVIGPSDVNQPLSVAVDDAGNLYVADAGHNRILMLSNGVLTTVAGNGTAGFSGDGGPATSAMLDFPAGVAVDASGAIYIVDTFNVRIRKVTKGVITTIAGNGTYGFSGDGGPATGAQLDPNLTAFCCEDVPTGLAVDAQGKVYFTDSNNSRVRVLTPSLAVLSPNLLTTGRELTPYSPVQFSAVAASGVVSWTATGLPGGLVINSAGVLSGTPALGSMGNYNPVFTATDSKGVMASTNLSLTIIAQPPAITSLSPNPVMGINANQTLFINGSGFMNGPGLTVRLTSPIGQVNLQGAQVTVFNSVQLSVSLNFSVAFGNWTVQVINADGQLSNIVFFSVAVPGPATTTNFASPHFVFGGAWYSALYFSNTGTAGVNVQVDFLAEDGSPLMVPLAGIGTVSSQVVSLPAGATGMLAALNGGNQTTDGWVEVALPPGVIGYGVFRQVVAGRADQEALVPFTPESSLTADFTYDERGLGTSVAFLNPSNQQVVVTITAYGPDGAPVGTTQVPLAPRSKLATVLDSLPGLSGMVDRQGRVVVSVPNGAVSVLSLRFGGAAFTNIPVTHR